MSGDPLGIIGSIAAVGVDWNKDNARILRFALQSVARELLPQEAVSKCLRHIVPKREFVEIRLSQNRKAHYANLIQCKSIWHCAVCSQRISDHRTKEIKKALEVAHERGLTVALGTFTLRHHRKQPLALLLFELKEAKRKFKSGWAYQQLKNDYGLVGVISSTEVTHGNAGWHPHQHDLFLFSQGELSIMESVIRDLWLAALTKLDTSAIREIGFKLTRNTEEIGNYVTKLSTQFNRTWGFAEEIGKANIKRTRGQSGNTPNDLLMKIMLHDDKQARRLWLEFASTLKGRNHIVWSRGLKALLGLGKDKTDGEIIDEVYEYDVFATLTRKQWAKVLRNERFGECRTDLLKAAEVGEEEFYLALLQWGLTDQD